MRTLASDGEVPTGKQATPYPDHQKVNNGYLKHNAEAFAGEITGAGGVGGTLDLPFDPGFVLAINGAGTPRLRYLFVGTTVQRGLDAAAATGLSIANDANGKPRRVTAAVALAANGEVVQILAFGFRDVNGSK